MKPTEIAPRRLASQGLIEPTRLTPRDVVEWLGAVQAQDYSGAKWGIGQRIAGATDTEIDRAFNAGEIIRTHVLRPTWHFVAPSDIRWMLRLTAPRVHTTSGYPYRITGITPKVAMRAHAVFQRALEGGQHRTRDELKLALERARIECGDPLKLAYLLMHAELEAIICSGPRRGNQFTYALLEERVAPARQLDPDEALGELARRYFRARGPATLRDFTMWAVLTMKDAKRAVDIVGADLERLELDDKPYWFSPASFPAKPKRPLAHLLPNYDEYFIGFRDRSAFSVAVKKAGANPPMSVLSAHIITIDGQIVGGWKRTVFADAVAVKANAIIPLSTSQRAAVNAAALGYGQFLGREVEIIWD